MANDISKEAKESLKTFEDVNKAVEKLNTALEKTHETLKEIADIAKETDKHLDEDHIKKVEESLNSASTAGHSFSKSIDDIGKGLADKLGKGSAETELMTENIKMLGSEVDSVISSASFTELTQEILGVVAGTRNLHSVWRVLSRFIGSKWGVALAASIGAISGLSQGISNVIALMKGMGGLVSSLTKGMFNFAASIVSIPFKLLALLYEVAETGPMSTELAQAIEDVRKEFGHLTNTVASATFEMSRSMEGFKQTGLSTWRVFGMLHERLKYFMEMQKEMGYTFDFIRGELLETEGALWAYQKALGMSGEDMKSTAQYALTMGRTFEDVVNEISKHTLAFSGDLIDKRFSRQVVKAVADVRHFGGATIKQVAAAAEFAKGLRVELEKIVGVMDAFETFDAAAENVSKLAQSFGVQVDAFKMVEAQDPASQIDMLRKSFFAAGKSAEGFNRQQIRLLAETTGLDEAIAKQVFSQKNQGKSLDEIRKKAEANEQRQLSQAEAMQKLAGAIERLIKQGERLKGGLFRQFFEGFGRGISLSRNFRKVMMNVRRSLRQARWAGIQFGRTFLDEKEGFPGLFKVAKGLEKLFDPKQVRKFFDEFANILKRSFKEFTSLTGPASFRNLMDRMKKHFYNYFDQKTPEGMELLQGVKQFFKIFTKVIAGGIHYAMIEMSKAFNMIADIIRHPEGIIAGIKAAATGTSGFVAKMLSPIVEAIVDAWPMFYDAIKNLFSTAWKKAVEFVKNTPEIRNVLLTLGTVMFAPVVVRTLVSMLGSILIGVFRGGFESAFKSPSKVKKILATVTKFFSGTVGKVLASAFAVVFVASLSVGIAEGVNKYKDKILGSFTEAEKTIAAGATGIIDALTFGLIPEDLLQDVANFFAKMTKKVKEGLNSVMGGLGDDVLSYYSSFMQLFSGIGNILVGLFTDDEDKLTKGITDLLEGLASTVFNYTKLFFIKLPLLVSKLAVRAITTIYGSIVDIAATVLEKLGMEQTSEFLHGLADGIRDAGKFIGKAFDWISVGINKLVSIVGDAFSYLGSIFSDEGEVGGLMDFIDTTVVGGFRMLVSIVSDVLDGLTGETNSKLGKWVFVIRRLLEIGIDYLVDAAKYFWSMTVSLGKVIKKAWDGITGTISSVFDWVVKKFGGASSWLSPVMDVFLTVFGGPLNKIVDLVKRVFKSVESILDIDEWFTKLGGKGKLPPEAVKKVKEAGKNAATEAGKALRDGAKSETSAFSITDYLGLDPDSIKSMDVSELKGLSKTVSDVKKIQDAMKDVTTDSIYRLTQQVTEIFGPTGGMSTLVDALNSLPKTDISSAASVMAQYSKLVESSAAVMKAGGVSQVISAVNDMVEATNKVDDSLSKIGKINVIARLKAVANNIGLGGKMRYTIKNKDVNIELNLTVVMDADKVEKVIVQRAKSVIRNRLNNAEYDEDKTKGQEPNIPVRGVIPPIGNGYVE